MRRNVAADFRSKPYSITKYTRHCTKDVTPRLGNPTDKGGIEDTRKLLTQLPNPISENPRYHESHQATLSAFSDPEHGFAKSY